MKWPTTPRMTQTDFEYIARIIADLPDPESAAILFSYHLKKTNKRFSREKFILLCLKGSQDARRG